MLKRIAKLFLVIFCSAITALVLAGFYHIATAVDAELVQPPAVASQNQATFGVVGDIMLSRNVAAKINRAKNPLLPFSKLAKVLQANDFNFANLESPFGGKDTFAPSPSMVFNAPRPNVKGLVINKFKVLSIANNHILDQGVGGLSYTRNYLAQNNLKTIGAGNNLGEAWQPTVAEANGIKIGFVAASYSSINDNGKKRNQYVARLEDIERLKSAIISARGQSDFVVVSMHAGTEYKYQPNEAQKKFARTAIDAGADMVIGHHPHWVQTIEKYKGQYIFYSLGNFIFDQEWSRQTKEGLMLKASLIRPEIDVEAHLSQIELMPVVIENYSTPRLANTKEAKAILGHIGITDWILK